MTIKTIVNLFKHFKHYAYFIESKDELKKIEHLIEQKNLQLQHLQAQYEAAYTHHHLLSFAPEEIKKIYEDNIQTYISYIVAKFDADFKKSILRGEKTIKFKVANPKDKDIEALNYIVDKLKMEGFDAQLSPIDLYTDGLTFAERQIFIIMNIDYSKSHQEKEYCING